MKDKFTVYSHVNILTGVTYIGITKRKPELRWNKGLGYKNNPHFWRAIMKYRWDGFTHNILYSDLDKELALKIEGELIAHYKKLGLSYNISDGNDYVGKIRSKPILVYSIDGKFISRCSSIAEASRKFGLSESGIYYCASLYRGTTKWGNYIFLFENSSISDRLKYIKTFHREAPNKRVIEMRDLNGNKLMEFPSLLEAAKFLNTKTIGNLSSCCSGGRTTYHGYKWNYK